VASSEERELISRARNTFLGQYIREPAGGGSDNIFVTIAVRHADTTAAPEPPGSWDAFLGTPPPLLLASAIATGSRSPTAPHELYEAVEVKNDEEPAPAAPGIPSAAILASFGINFAIPFDRLLLPAEVEAVLCLRVNELPGADVFSTKPDGSARTTAEQAAFVSAEGFNPTKSALVLYCKSRGLQYSAGKKEELLAAARISVDKEALDGKFLLMDYADGRHEKQRRTRLIEAGILTSTNAPGLVPLPTPDRSDHRWNFTTKDLFDGTDMCKVMVSWYEMFFPTASCAGLYKAQNKLVAGRAYYSRALAFDEHLYISFRTDASQIKETRVVDFVFDKSVGHDEAKELALISARCTPSDVSMSTCTAGDNYACCSHILTGLCALTQLQSGVITAGNIGDGDKAWGGLKKTSHVPVQSMHNISLLVPGGARLREFTGFRPNAPPLKSAMGAFFERLGQLAAPTVPPLIVEIHHGVEIRRAAPADPDPE
jgi:hypothetical protein